MAHHRARLPRARRIAGAAALVAAGLAGVVAPAGALPATDAAPAARSAAAGPSEVEVPSPTVTGPVEGQPFTVSPPVDYEARGYVQEEYFLEGTAQAYLDDGDWGDDGRWDARPNPDARAPYTTRVLVRRPTDPAAFNGTVLVEWMNVSGGLDVEPDWVWMRDELLRRGYAYVGVSAQKVGVDALGGDTARYGELSHPGDAFSYDMFSQAARAATVPADGGPRPLGELTGEVERLLATGESQSGGRLITYANAVHPLVGVFDGILIHSAASGAALSQPSAPGAPSTPSIPGDEVPRPVTRLRTDLDEPILVVNTETDVVPFGNLGPSGIHEQPDGPGLRIWELTGTAHVDTYLLADLDCGVVPINDGPQTYGLRAAVRQLDLWVRTGRPAPRGHRISVTEGTVDRDPDTGLGRGGIRLPDVAVPTRTLSGSRPPDAGGDNPFCFLAGARDPWNGDTDPWDGQEGLDLSPTPEPVLSELYRDHRSYVGWVGLAALHSTLRGHVLPEDLHEIVETAREADVP